jgi:hypothetical protein
MANLLAFYELNLKEILFLTKTIINGYVTTLNLKN